MGLHGNMYSVKCDFCDQPATSFDRQHLCIKHSQIRDRIRKKRNMISAIMSNENRSPHQI